MFFVGARKPLFSRIYHLRHDGLPSYDLMVVSVLGNFCEIELVWQKITLCEYLSQTPADEKRAQLSIYDQFFESFVSSTKWGGLWWVRILFIVATHILNVKMPTLGYLFEFDLSTLPEAVPGSDLHEKSCFSYCWFSYDPRSFRGQMFWDHKNWWTLWLSQPDT